MNKSNAEKMTYEELLERDGSFLYTSVGISMMPLIRQGEDAIYIRARERDGEGRVLPLHELDVALFRRGQKYVLHRVLEVLPDGSYTICGDNQYAAERVEDRQVIGILDKIIRGENEIDPRDPAYLAELEMDLGKRKKTLLWRNIPQRIKGKIRRMIYG